MDASDPILIEDLNGVVVDLNAEAQRSYGFARGDLIGRPIKQLVPPERHEQADELLRRCLAGEEVRNVEGLRWDRDGQVVPVLLTVSLLRGESGEPLAIATLAKDITAQKQAEAESRRMAKVFMDASDPILIEDLDGVVVDLNAEVERRYGFSRERLIGRPIKQLVPPERHHQADSLLERCLAGEDVRNVEGLRWDRDGTVVPVLLTLSALRGESGEPVAVATIAKDISRQKQAEAALAQEREQLEVRVSERTHELQTARTDLQELAEKLAKYLSPQLYEKLFEGSADARIQTRRKWLTVFFSDIVEFTSTSEALDPEELTTHLNQYFVEMTQIVFKHGGTLDKYIGDAILVFFGDPDTRGEEEDACACVCMALEMQARLISLREQWAHRGLRQPFHVRMGITSGHCTVGNFGSEQHLDYTVIGRQVNLASRLESAATADQILISKPTWSLINERIRCTAEDPVVAKGFAEPVEVYSAVGPRDSELDSGVIQRAVPGFSLWVDPDRVDAEERELAVRQLERAIQAIRIQAEKD